MELNWNNNLDYFALMQNCKYISSMNSLFINKILLLKRISNTKINLTFEIKFNFKGSK
jgi:hypothetical protein